MLNFQSIVVVMTLVIALTVGSCIAETKQAAQQEPYFSVKDYMKKEIRKYEARKPQLYRVAKVNQKTESDTVQPSDSTTWWQLFSQLIEADINKPALLGSYSVSVDSSGNEVITRYLPKKEDLKVRLFEVRKKEGEVQRLFVKVSTSNVIYSSEKRFIYYPDSLYLVTGTQDLVAGGMEKMEMKVLFK